MFIRAFLKHTHLYINLKKGSLVIKILRQTKELL